MGCITSKPGPVGPQPQEDKSWEPRSASSYVDGSDGSFSWRIEAPRYSADEFRRAADKYSARSQIGSSSTGPLHKGHLRGHDVAIRKLTSNSQLEEDFLQEVAVLSGLRHPNVVPLIAYCSEARNRALAFEYAPLGSLADVLHGKRGSPPPPNALSWSQRLDIALDAAEGLCYLHQGPASSGLLVHKRVKSSNILLYPDGAAKIGDCNIVPEEQESIMVAPSVLPLGNFVVNAPEAYLGELSQKSDVFSFGIVLLELLSGRPAILPASSSPSGRCRKPESINKWALHHFSLQEYRECLDERLSCEDIPDKRLKMFCSLATGCLAHDPDRRPDMRTVLKCLEAISRKSSKMNHLGNHESRPQNKSS